MDIIKTIIAGLGLAVLIFYFKIVWHIPDSRKVTILQIAQMIAVAAGSGMAGYSIGGGQRDVTWGMALIFIIFVGTEIVAFYSPHSQANKNTNNQPDDKTADAKGSGPDN